MTDWPLYSGESRPIIPLCMIVSFNLAFYWGYSNITHMLLAMVHYFIKVISTHLKYKRFHLIPSITCDNVVYSKIWLLSTPKKDIQCTFWMKSLIFQFMSKASFFQSLCPIDLKYSHFVAFLAISFVIIIKHSMFISITIIILDKKYLDSD